MFCKIHFNRLSNEHISVAVTVIIITALLRIKHFVIGYQNSKRQHLTFGSLVWHDASSSYTSVVT